MLRGGRLLLAVLAVVSAGLVLPPAVSAGAQRLVEVPRVTVGDSDGDGLPEASSSGVAGGPCACRCHTGGLGRDGPQ